MHLNSTLSNLSMLLWSFYKNLCLSLNNFANNPAYFSFPPSDSTTPAPIASSSSLRTRSISYFMPSLRTCSNLVHQTHCLPQLLPINHLPTTFSRLSYADTAHTSLPIVSGASLPLQPCHNQLFSSLTSYHKNNGFGATKYNPICFGPHVVPQPPPPRCNYKANLLFYKKR